MDDYQPGSHRQRFIVVNYSADQEGQVIRDEDVVRPLNHRWTICYTNDPDAEILSWQKKSYAGCPTYGSCQKCLKSGPVGKVCNECPIKKFKPGYVIMGNEDGSKILDSITIAQMLGRPHETAMADRVLKPGMDRIEFVDWDRIFRASLCASGQIYGHIQNLSERLLTERIRRDFMDIMHDENNKSTLTWRGLEIKHKINKIDNDQPGSNHQRFIVVNYLADQEGQDIRDEDMVRPLNHRWTDRWTRRISDRNDTTELGSFYDKSYTGNPTYGSCQYCLKSGPVGKVCNECPIENDLQPGYVILISEDGSKLLDSITIAQMLGQGHETAKADQLGDPLMDRIEEFNLQSLIEACWRIYYPLHQPFLQYEMTHQATLDFQEMMRDDNAGNHAS